MKNLYIFIEGDDFVKLVKHRKKKNEDIDRFLWTIKKMKADYIFTRDINGSPCVTDRKQRLLIDFKNINEEKIIIVKREIESWFLAGLNEISSKKCGVKSFDNTEHIAKTQFDDIIPKKFDSRIDFMQEILKFFCMETAKLKNNSFKYFIDKYRCEV